VEVGKADWGCAELEAGEGGCGTLWARPAREREEAKSGSRASSSTISDFWVEGGCIVGEGWTCAAAAVADVGGACIEDACGGARGVVVEDAVDGYERFAAAAAREAVLEDELPILHEYSLLVCQERRTVRGNASLGIRDVYTMMISVLQF
jgi:hypothetical protein